MTPYVPDRGDPPSPFGKYRILRRLGGGGFGRVYQAEDTVLGRTVALKVPRPGGPMEPATLHRFLREARAAAQLHHPNLCPVYEAGEIGGTHYLTMLFIDGPTLKDRLHEAAYASREAVVLVETLARALAAAHARGVVHRDLKPANIVLDARQQPVVVDFGLALRLADDTRLTEEGAGLGTPLYMPPEQFEGQLKEMGPGCDIYNLGVILYELLAGKVPFEGNQIQVFWQKSHGPFVPPSKHRAGVDAALDAVCARAMARKVTDRYPTMEAFADELAGYLNAGTVLPVRGGPQPPAGDSTTSTMHTSDPRVAGEVLELLQQWGWDEGMARFKAQIALVEGSRSRGVRRLLAGWVASQQGDHAAGVEQFQQAAAVPELRPWALAGMAFVQYRTGRPADLDAAWSLLDQAEPEAGADPALLAAIAHCRGTIRYRQARLDEALDYLFQAADLSSPGHFGYGRVLDSLGMVYAARNDFDTAAALYRQSLQAKESAGDLLGRALTFGQMGRLYLDWGELEQAADAFREDLRLCQRTHDVRGEAQVYNFLGQVCLQDGQVRKALDYLEESVCRNQAGGWAMNEALARKDRALALLALGRVDEAAQEVQRAEALAEGRADAVFHARRAKAQVHAARGEYPQAERLLRDAAAHFATQNEPAEAARTHLELARVLRLAAARLVPEVLLEALDWAERSRRDRLIRTVEEELRGVSEAALYRRAYRRARGWGIRDDVAGLSDVRGEKATVLFLDLRDFTGFSLVHDPRAVQATLNQVFAQLAPAVERQKLVVNQYLGDGFMAFAREDGHPQRAVRGGLEMLQALAGLNRPRRLLGLPALHARIGVATGDVVFGNLGTHRKIDFTAVGPTVNLAARLQGEAAPGAVCVSQGAYERIKDSVHVQDERGRLVTLKGIGEVRVWDVTAPI